MTLMLERAALLLESFVPSHGTCLARSRTVEVYLQFLCI